jgi:hypothetical protein
MAANQFFGKYMLFLRRLPPNEAWLLVFFALVLTADFIRVSVTVKSLHNRSKH